MECNGLENSLAGHACFKKFVEKTAFEQSEELIPQDAIRQAWAWQPFGLGFFVRNLILLEKPQNRSAKPFSLYADAVKLVLDYSQEDERS
jgi:hypothetical protein